MSILSTTPTVLDKNMTTLVEQEVIARLREAHELLLFTDALIRKHVRALAACGSCLVAPKFCADQLTLDEVLYGLEGIGAELYIQRRTGGFPIEPTKEAVDIYMNAIEDARENWAEAA
jgi:hypothetical protein